MSWIGLVSFPVWSVDEGENPLVFLVDDEEYFYGRQNDLTEQPNTHTHERSQQPALALDQPPLCGKNKKTPLYRRNPKTEDLRTQRPRKLWDVLGFAVLSFSALLVATITLINEITSPLKDTAIVAESCNCIGQLFELVFVAF